MQTNIGTYWKRLQTLSDDKALYEMSEDVGCAYPFKASW